MACFFFFWALLWGSMIHKHTGRWIWQGSASVIFWNWEKYSCHSKLVSTFLVLPSFPRNNSQDWWNSGGLQWTQVFRHISTALDADGQRTQRWSGWLFRAYRVNVLVSVPLEEVSVSQCPIGPDSHWFCSDDMYRISTILQPHRFEC